MSDDLPWRRRPPAAYTARRMARVEETRALGLADVFVREAERGLNLDEPSLGTRLQEIADAAAQEVKRPVAIDDRQLRLLVHTEHADDVDAVRLDSILKRPLRPEVLAWVHAHDVVSARRAVRVRPNAELGMHPRVCVPIRSGEHLLGYLWLTDRDESLADAELARLEEIADEAGIVLHRELLLRDLDRSRERELVRDILSEDRGVRRHAAQQLVAFEIVERDGPTVVLVASTPAAGATGDELRAPLDAAANRVRRHLAQKRALHLLRPDHVLLVVSCNEPSVRRRGVVALAEQFRDELTTVLDRSHGPVRVAIGGRVDGLDGARESYEQALRAATVAGHVESRFGAVVSWDELGIYRLLAELPVGELGMRLVHPGLRTLLEKPQTHFLVHTLECYLDQAGDAQATAATLFVHRTTLYHRLRRIEEVGGINLRDGEERLELHLGLKLARLQGLQWSAEPAPE